MPSPVLPPVRRRKNGVPRTGAKKRTLPNINIRPTANGLVDGQYNGLVTDGTPVVARLTLRDDGPLAGVGDGFIDFLRRIGL